MIGADDLWRSILQYAVQGKLVPQDPNDEPASVLLDRVCEEKQRLIREGKIKKEKDVSRIYRKGEMWFESEGNEEMVLEVPFEIPDSWEWIRLQSVCRYIHRGKSPKYSHIKKYPVVAQKCNQWNGLDMSKCLFIEPESFTKYNVESVLKTGDILINSTGTGTCGRTGIYNEQLNEYELAVADSHITVIRTLVFAKYIYYYFAGPLFQNIVEEISNGSTNQIELSTSSIQSTLIPLPPFCEQQRIVTKIEELRPLVDRYRELERERCALDESISSLLRRSILQYAVQGKLVPQDPDDEPASVLLERVREEMQKLVKEGKIKKEKNESRIYHKDGRWFESKGKDEVEIEVPFEIPDTWCWVRGYSLFENNESTKPSGDVFEYIDIDSIDNGSCVIEKVKLIPTKGATSRARRKLHSGDVLFSTVRPYLRNIAIVEDDNENAIASTGFYVCRTRGILTTHYLFNMLQSSYICDGLTEIVKGERSPSVSNDDFLQYLYPVPPLSDQKCIVTRIEELRAYTDRLNELMADD